ncbi:deoxyribonuclease [Halorubrum sp. C3]|nr:deoxyribonuclease [Halorubrum sp. C3]
MEISDQLLCLFSGRVEQRGGSYVVEVPERELELGELEEGGVYRVGIVPAPQTGTDRDGDESGEPDAGGGFQGPPVEVGETRAVEIEGIGDQGDGIARVERGYVVIVPDTEKGERVRVEVTDVQQNVAFANVTERLSYYE